MQKEEEHKESVDTLVCPSFSTYSSDKLADIADQVTRDHLRSQNDNDFDANDVNDFEFVAFRKAADGVFFEGNAGPVFPIFNRDLVTMTAECDCDRHGEGEGRGRRAGAEEDAIALQFPMGKLLIGEEDRRPDPPSSSSSEVDELEAIPAGTYCVWTPNSVQASPNRCKKSKSTGSSSSSKRWKLLDLLRRSNSDGKDTFVFLTPSNSAKKKKEEAKAENSKERRDSGNNNESAGGKVAGKKVAGGVEKKVPVSAHEALYVRNREMRRVYQRRSYLPYRQDLVGFFTTLNGMGRAFAPF